MKIFVKLFLILIYCCSLSACQQAKTDKTEITFWTLQLNNFAPFIKEKISIYEKKHPKIKIKWIDIPFSEGEKRTLSAVMSKDVPDLINLTPSFSTILQKKNVLAPINAKLENYYILPALKLCRNNGEFFAIPWYVTSYITIYNKALLKGTGYKTPPETYDDILPFSLMIKNKTNKYAFMPNLAEDGAMLKIMSKQGISIQNFAKSQKTKDIYKIFKQLYCNNLIPKGAINQTHRDSLEKYMAGETVFLESGANFLNIIKENAPQVYKNTDIASQMNTHIGVIDLSLMNLVIPKKSKNKKIAQDFALFITNTQNQSEFCKLAPVLPSAKLSLENDFFNQDKTLIERARKISAKQIKKAQNTLEINPNQKQINEIIDYTTQNILLEKKSIDDALKECNKKLFSYFQPGKSRK